MKILFYSANRDRITEDLWGVVKECVPQQNLAVSRTFAGLTRKLRQPNNNIGIAVLITTNRQQFRDIVSLGDLLSDIRVILVLPDRKGDTISKAHNLGPRFLTYLDNNSKEIKAVLSKMLENQNANKN